MLWKICIMSLFSIVSSDTTRFTHQQMTMKSTSTYLFTLYWWKMSLKDASFGIKVAKSGTVLLLTWSESNFEYCHFQNNCGWLCAWAHSTEIWQEGEKETGGMQQQKNKRKDVASSSVLSATLLFHPDNAPVSKVKTSPLPNPALAARLISADYPFKWHCSLNINLRGKFLTEGHTHTKTETLVKIRAISF